MGWSEIPMSSGEPPASAAVLEARAEQCPLPLLAVLEAEAEQLRLQSHPLWCALCSELHSAQVRCEMAAEIRLAYRPGRRYSQVINLK